MLISLIPVTALCAESDHVIIEDYSDYMTSEQYVELNDDLERVKERYDIDFYFIYDTSIENSDSAVNNYADDFLKANGSAGNNVAIVATTDHYCVRAQGTAADEVLKNDETIWNKFYRRASMISTDDPNAFYEGIKEAYQYTIGIINGVVYDSQAPISVLKALVNDYADLLSDSEEEKLNRRLQAIKDKYGLDVVILTTNSYNGMDESDYADDFYDYSQYGDDGVLLVLNPNDGVYISTAGKGYDYITDYGIDLIFDDMWDDLLDGKYYDAFVTFAKDVDEFIESGEQGNIVDIDTTERKPRFGIFNISISALIGALSSLIASLSLNAKMHNTRRQTGARNYVVSNSFYINGASDMLVNRHVTRSRRPRSNDNMRDGSSSGHFSGGGGSHIHTSSSGTTHGGHGKHF